MAAPLAASDLTERIAILIFAQTPSPRGGVERSEQLLRKVWAQPMEGMAREFVKGGEEFSQARASFRIRFAADIAALGTKFRVGWAGRGKLYDVTGVTGTRGLGELRLQCEAVGNYSDG